MSSIEKTLQKVPMPPRTRSRTEILPQTENITEESPGTTANLAPVEAVTGLASEESRDAGNTGSIRPSRNFRSKLQHYILLSALPELADNKWLGVYKFWTYKVSNIKYTILS